MTMPEAVVSSPSLALTTTRSSSGFRLNCLPIPFSFLVRLGKLCRFRLGRQRRDPVRPGLCCLAVQPAELHPGVGPALVCHREFDRGRCRLEPPDAVCVSAPGQYEPTGHV